MKAAWRKGEGGAVNGDGHLPPGSTPVCWVRQVPNPVGWGCACGGAGQPKRERESHKQAIKRHPPATLWETTCWHQQTKGLCVASSVVRPMNSTFDPVYQHSILFQLLFNGYNLVHSPSKVLKNLIGCGVARALEYHETSVNPSVRTATTVQHQIKPMNDENIPVWGVSCLEENCSQKTLVKLIVHSYTAVVRSCTFFLPSVYVFVRHENEHHWCSKPILFLLNESIEGWSWLRWPVAVLILIPLICLLC